MLESMNNTALEYKKLTPEEMKERGILGRLVGICASFIAPTRNGRKYPEQLWENVFNDEIMKERIANGVCYGELGHPTDREETDPEKICICMPEEPKKGPDGKLRAVFDILDTPNGRILKTLCDYGSKLGISSRGSGDLETGFDGQESVNPNTYNCEGFDIVLLPGVKEARLQYVTESLDKKRYNKTLRQKLTEGIVKETEEHRKIVEESLNSLGINLNESYGFVTSKKKLNEFKKLSKLLNNELSLYDKILRKYESNATTEEEQEALEHNKNYQNLIKIYNSNDELIEELNKIISDGSLVVDDDSRFSDDKILLGQNLVTTDDLYALLNKLQSALKIYSTNESLNAWDLVAECLTESFDDDSKVYEVARYNLQGMPIKESEKGIQIVVYSNYTTKTIIKE